MKGCPVPTGINRVHCGCRAELSTLSRLRKLHCTFALVGPQATTPNAWGVAGRAAAAALGASGIAQLTQLEDLALHVLHTADVHAFQPRQQQPVPAAAHFAQGNAAQHPLMHAAQANAAMQQAEANARVASSWHLPASLPLRHLSLHGLALGHQHLIGSRYLAVRICGVFVSQASCPADVLALSSLDLPITSAIWTAVPRRQYLH